MKCCGCLVCPLSPSSSSCKPGVGETKKNSAWLLFSFWFSLSDALGRGQDVHTRLPTSWVQGHRWAHVEHQPREPSTLLSLNPNPIQRQPVLPLGSWQGFPGVISSGWIPDPPWRRQGTAEHRHGLLIGRGRGDQG